MLFIAGLLSIWALVIAGTDLRQLRVPNSLLLLVFIPALLIQFLNGVGVFGLTYTSALLGMGLGFLLGIPGLFTRQFGAGDVKYMAVLGFLCGPAGTGEVLLPAALVLGLMSLVVWGRAYYKKCKPGRVPAAIAISLGFLLFLYQSGKFDHGL